MIPLFSAHLWTSENLLVIESNAQLSKIQKRMSNNLPCEKLQDIQIAQHHSTLGPGGRGGPLGRVP